MPKHGHSRTSSVGTRRAKRSRQRKKNQPTNTRSAPTTHEPPTINVAAIPDETPALLSAEAIARYLPADLTAEELERAKKAVLRGRKTRPRKSNTFTLTQTKEMLAKLKCVHDELLALPDIESHAATIYNVWAAVPEDMRFGKNKQAVYEAIGNAVAPLFERVNSLLLSLLGVTQLAAGNTNHTCIEAWDAVRHTALLCELLPSRFPLRNNQCISVTLGFSCPSGPAIRKLIGAHYPPKPFIDEETAKTAWSVALENASQVRDDLETNTIYMLLAIVSSTAPPKNGKALIIQPTDGQENVYPTLLRKPVGDRSLLVIASPFLDVDVDGDKITWAGTDSLDVALCSDDSAPMLAVLIFLLSTATILSTADLEAILQLRHDCIFGEVYKRMHAPIGIFDLPFKPSHILPMAALQRFLRSRLFV